MAMMVRMMLVLMLTCAQPRPAISSVQDGFICWDPDVEFPVACEGEE